MNRSRIARESNERVKNMRSILIDYLKVPYEERLKLVTHFKHHTIQPHNTVRLGMVKGNVWIDLYIDMHKSEVKRKKIPEYKPKEGK